MKYLTVKMVIESYVMTFFLFTDILLNEEKLILKEYF